MIFTNNFLKNFRVWCGAAYLCFGAVNASASSSINSSLNVQTTVPSVCTISTGNLNFPNYLGLVTNAQASLSVTCANGYEYDIGLNQGLGSGATVTDRYMTSGPSTLLYRLYSNSGRTTIWGNTVGNDTVHATGSGSFQSYSIYGQIPASQPIVPGTYQDIVTVTLYF